MHNPGPAVLLTRELSCLTTVVALVLRTVLGVVLALILRTVLRIVLVAVLRTILVVVLILVIHGEYPP